MAKRAPATVSFEAVLRRPARPQRATWAFLLLPAAASRKLPARGQVTVDGRFAGQAFQATLEPDGEGSHWLKVEKPLLEAAGAQVGDAVALEVTPVAEEPEPDVPADVRKALAEHPTAKTTWDDITAIARRDWIQWMTSGKKAETRVKRIATACDMLASGKRRACCFDRSGRYSRGKLGPPEAAD
ncbi:MULTISPECIES: YdeI/OmpD-associated family protein [unclassified Luteimonas]|uniref:YdeI/OmpD-associated family protein n=1 Tax=unclassified Luteimonas TaxID=2629088 RepID=UPI0018F08370|nr:MULTISPECIES: YdeI/OmpD-associated family protein [unclassified Luteimonas]MBJ6979761.1 DUF1905 domain-containing protein [Luteimonas sp. MC1895]MBJ6985548.1 DUF1905 domain-containing protein [Luteimonas sp. MC1750]QQO05968.1 DUF1905 domain-containing protein [Luteimonas sp. MC1750]